MPGYEILSVLGGGGMGVVYQARQVGLNRVVALKMIRDAALADSETRARFQREAEAVARLIHPHVVQIHDIGECDGLPYFAFEYCAGGSLAALLRGTPLPARKAAALTQTLARAIQVAHEAGIVHRDLKPANVLMQPVSLKAGVETTDRSDGVPERPHDSASSSVDDFLPKIADFGLAKTLDVREGAAETASGAILGTPSYMAPEQARGATKVRQPGEGIGRATDVYALGAILYELLTGRPPFRAATTVDTIFQVIHDDPVPPNRLNAGTPDDINTICLQCLEKDPGKRYGSAIALADDLERFLHGEPIVARPVGHLERSVKWVRRRPAAAAAIAVSLAAAFTLLIGGTWFTLRLHWANEETILANQGLIMANAEIKQRRLEAEAAAKKSRESLVRLSSATGNNAAEAGDWWTALLWYHRAWELDHGPGEAAGHRQRMASVLGRCPRLLGICLHNDFVREAEFTRSGERIVTLTENSRVPLESSPQSMSGRIATQGRGASRNDGSGWQARSDGRERRYRPLVACRGRQTALVLASPRRGPLGGIQFRRDFPGHRLCRWLRAALANRHRRSPPCEDRDRRRGLVRCLQPR